MSKEEENHNEGGRIPREAKAKLKNLQNLEIRIYQKLMITQPDTVRSVPSTRK